MTVLNLIHIRDSEIRSGMVTLVSGVILSVERCAPEHGGGILLCFNHSDQHLPSGQAIYIVGSVPEETLDVLRQIASIRTGRDYTRGVR